MRLKQELNSYQLNSAAGKIAAAEEKAQNIQKERKRLEEQVANLKAQETAWTSKAVMIRDFEEKQLKQEAVELTDAMMEIKEVENGFAHMIRLPEEDRFLGKNGDGNATYMRSVFGLSTKGELDDLNALERRACLTCAAVFGAETKEEWKAKWNQPPVDNWTEVVGVKHGNIPTNNSVTADKAGDIMFHLMELSPVETPPQSRKRRRSSLSRGRSRSRGRSQSRGRSLSRSGKKPRLSIEAIATSVAIALGEHLGGQSSESESEGEEVHK